MGQPMGHCRTMDSHTRGPPPCIFSPELFGIPNSLFGIPNRLFGIPNSLFGIPNSLFGILNSSRLKM